jgi:L-alanine-DL-glutamate epimerase-like enolase superfamily enzyme
MDRRTFLSRLLSAPLAAAYARAAQAAPPLRITGLETVCWKSRDDAPFWPHWTWLRIHTDGGVFGGAELRALSAIDLALWDILGKSLNAPVYRLIAARPIRIEIAVEFHSNWNLPSASRIAKAL